MYIPFLFLLPFCSATTLPPPTGPHQLLLTNSELIDTSRPDPWGKDVIPYRRLMISRFDPLPLNTSCSYHEKVDYMTPTMSGAMDDLFVQIGVPANLFSSLEMEFCSPLSQEGEYPLVLLSPGYNATRLLYALLAQEIASQGYTVITIDHPYDTTVEFPDGTLAVGGNMNLSDPSSVNHAIDIRAADLTFTLNTLSIPPTTSVLAFGHSFGGATVAQTMMYDTRIRGGVNLDGGLFGSVVTTGFPLPPSSPDQPQSFINWGAETHNRTSQPDWGTFYDKLKTQNIWERELGLRDAKHGTFWDLPSILDFKGVRGNVSAVGVGFIGTLKGERGLEVLSRYLGDYFGFVLKGNQGEGLLGGASGEFPEVLFLG